jgi:predicted phage baseplate assembly protein
MALPIPKLDDRTFEQLVEEGRKLIPIYAPRWTNHNLSDTGITLMDLFAWLTEMQLYNLDFIGESHRLKYLALLGIRPRPAAPARVELQFSAAEPINCIPVCKGTPFKTDSTVFPLIFESEEDIKVIPIDLKEVLSYSNYRFTPVTEFNDHPQTYFHAFGEHPEEGDALYLGFDLRMAFKYLAGRMLRLAVYPYEDDLPPVGEGLAGEDKTGFRVYPSAVVIWELWKEQKKHWVPLKVTAADENIPVLSRKGILFIQYDDSVEGTPAVFPPALTQYLSQYSNPVWIRCRLKKVGYEIPPRIDRILPNVVPAVEGESEEEVWESSGLPDQVFKTGKYPIVPGSQTIKIEDKLWEAVADFDVSGPGDHHYVIEPGKGEIRFSNGVNGAVPSKGKNIIISYRSGGGIKGNVKADTITIKGSDVTGITVTNPYPAYGGEEAESVKNAFIRLKRNMEVPYTAVTAGDYEYIAKATPGLRVARARAVILDNSDSQNDLKEVIVVVIPYSFLENPLPGEAFKQTVRSYLDLHRLVTTVVTVSDSDYVRVSVTGEIKVKAGYDAEQIKKRTADELDCFLSPLRRKSGDNEWPFGRPVYSSEINEVMEGVEGVDCVTSISLSGSGGSFEILEGYIEIGPLSLVYPGDHEIRVFDPYEKCKKNEKPGVTDEQ